MVDAAQDAPIETAPPPPNATNREKLNQFYWDRVDPIIRYARRNPPLIFGSGLIIALLLFVVIGHLVWNEELYRPLSAPTRQAPSWEYPFGTDTTGRDLLAVAIKGTPLTMRIGLIAGFGFYCLSQSYRIAPASVVAPFEFISMPLAVLWGIAIWSEYPPLTTLFGIALIIGSGVYVLHREAVRKRPLSTGRGVRLRL